MPRLRIAFASSEVAPWSKTGGLGDVAGDLPRAFADSADLDVAVFTPLYRSAAEQVRRRGCTLAPAGPDFSVQGRPARFLRLQGGDHPTTFFLDAPHLFDRAGIYGPASSQAYTDTGAGSFSDNLHRFGGFCEAVLEHAARLMGGAPDVVHAHDWQAALLPGLLAGRADRPATVLTIHNLAYQGAFAAGDVGGRPAPDGYLRDGHLNLLAGAISAADRVTTVSPNYAHEITTPEFGCGLDGLLRHRGVTGVLNGIDADAWDPRTDPALPAPFSADDRAGRATGRRALLSEFGLPDEPGTLLLGMVSRLAGQKGPELVADLVPRLGSLRARLVVLGSGDKALEALFSKLAQQHHHRLGVRLDFDLELARRIYGACDGMLIPSRFEPCGLVQMYAMRYGSVPIASAVGGLVDTVRDPGDDALARGEGTGFLMEAVSSVALAEAVERAGRLLRRDPDGFARVQNSGMTADWSWAASAQAWADLYREVAEERAG